ncbi:MAG: nuclear transport factor 2 family protein, partial [Actinomycetota bacterium]|nr:nuclear transport factor 2 family protein [Actinomycetota bacterium]
VEAPGYVFVDHRLGGTATMDEAGTSTAGLKSAHRAARGLRFDGESIGGLDDGTTDVGIARVVAAGESIDSGGRFEVPFLSVTAGQGPCTYRVEMWEAEAEEDAMRRFDELCADAFDGVTLSPRATAPIPSAVVAHARRWAAASDARVRVELVEGAAAGERWAFAAIVALTGTPGGAAVVSGCGERTTHDETFAGDDLDAALRRYEELHTTMMSGGWLEALEAHDWEAARALLADDMVVVDHRLVGWGESMGADRIIAATRSLGETSPDARWTSRLLEQHCDGDRVVERLRLALRGTTDGAPWEQAFLLVGVIEGGLRTRFEFFDADDEGPCRARYEELRTQPVAAQG